MQYYIWRFIPSCWCLLSWNWTILVNLSVPFYTVLKIVSVEYMIIQDTYRTKNEESKSRLLCVYRLIMTKGGNCYLILLLRIVATGCLVIISVFQVRSWTIYAYIHIIKKIHIHRVCFCYPSRTFNYDYYWHSLLWSSGRKARVDIMIGPFRGEND